MVDSKYSQPLNCTKLRMIYIATDEPKTVIEEAKEKWGNRYKIYHGNLNKPCEIILLIIDIKLKR
jgi:hypothetical protein